MNILRLKQLIAGLPDVVTSLQFGAVETEYEDLLAQQRADEEAELAELQARAAALQVKLGLQRSQDLAAASIPPPVRPPPTARPSREGGDTDFDMGISYAEPAQDGADFRAELADARQRSTERRAARRGH